MLKLIYGPPGSGKTHLTDSLIMETLSDNKRVTLLVPEQEAIEAENRIYERAVKGSIPIEKLTVVSFRRLANLAFRKHGGIEYNNIGDGGRLIVLWRIIEELAPALKNYNKSRDRSLVELMLSVCEELKRYCVTPSALSAAADAASDTNLKNKLNDIALIYAAYSAQMSELYSDNTDDVNRLAEIYRVEAPDADEIFFVDSFNGFTQPELQVLEALIRHCDVTVTVNRFSENGKIGFKTVEKTEADLIKLAEKSNAKITVAATLSAENGYSNDDFKLIKNRLYDLSYASPQDHSSANIGLTVCQDSFYQAEFIAINICKLVRNGARYRDIAVISRNTDRYEGVLDVVFEKYGIPLFLSKRSKLTSTSLFRAVTNALNIISDGYQTDYILSYIKSGVCNFSLREIDLIESYVSLWNINGKRWTSESDWVMNPDGFTDRISSSASDILKEINSIRSKIITPIIELSDDIKSASINDACKALYRFILKSGIAEHFRVSKNNSDITVYNAFIKLIGTLAEVGNDIPVNAHMLSSLLYLMAKNTDYGKIPSSFDRVTAGDASIIRCNGVKHVFLTDCESGVFPSAVTDDSFFSEKEKEYLLENKIMLSPNISEKNDLEAFYFLRSASGATETLTATYCMREGKKYPSIGFQRLCALFPANTVTEYPKDYPVTDRIQTEATSKEIYSALNGSDFAAELEKVYSELGIISAKLNSGTLSEPTASLSLDTVNELFGSNINMTASRLESYVKCPFSYFCNHVLGLKEKKHSFFMASDMGNYIHRILEIAIQELFKDRVARDITDIDIEEAVDKALHSVLNDILGQNSSNEGKRFEALILRLRRTLLLLVTNIASEFKSSKFTPKFFEFKIGNENSQAAPLKFTLSDGTKISVYGTIDRVDTYNKDGNVYVRVVDYKSGNAPHSVSNISYGLDTQMLLYLFSIWRSNSKEFYDKLGKSEDGQIIPAGVLYQTARMKVTDTSTPVSYEQSLKLADKNLVRHGILLDDPEILEAMESGLNGNYIPVTRKSDGSIKASANILISLDGFGELLNTIEKTFIEIGAKMKSGNACAAPLRLADKDACKYCQLYPICRSRYSQNNGS